MLVLFFDDSSGQRPTGFIPNQYSIKKAIVFRFLPLLLFKDQNPPEPALTIEICRHKSINTRAVTKQTVFDTLYTLCYNTFYANFDF